jgi:hypothetical protein
MTDQILLLLVLLALKHFIADGPLQTAYQYENKGRLDHPGGILHAGIHGALTTLCVMTVDPTMSLILGCLDFSVHFYIDYFKVNLTKSYGWSKQVDCDGRKRIQVTSDWYFYALILDQSLHFMTYAVIARIAG